MNFFIKLGRHVSHGEKMNSIDFVRSNVKVTVDIYGNKLVNMIATKPLHFFVKLDSHVNHDESINPIDFRCQ